MSRSCVAVEPSGLYLHELKELEDCVLTLLYPAVCVTRRSRYEINYLSISWLTNQFWCQMT